jgi:hypothetical protein
VKLDQRWYSQGHLRKSRFLAESNANEAIAPLHDRIQVIATLIFACVIKN